MDKTIHQLINIYNEYINSRSQMQYHIILVYGYLEKMVLILLNKKHHI